MVCSGCNGEMKELELQGVTIDRCAKCGGVWLDAGEAEELAAKSKGSAKDALKRKKYELLRAWKVAPQDPKETERGCPRCEKHLVRVNYKDIPGLVVDKCPYDCGLYLDQGELDKVKLIG